MTTNNEPTVEQLADIVREHLTAAYVCNRVWEAWSYNTMGPDDFIEASETEMADEIAAAVFERFNQPAMPADALIAEQAREIASLKHEINTLQFRLRGVDMRPQTPIARRRIEGEP